MDLLPKYYYGRSYYHSPVFFLPSANFRHVARTKVKTVTDKGVGLCRHVLVDLWPYTLLNGHLLGRHTLLHFINSTKLS